MRRFPHGVLIALGKMEALPEPLPESVVRLFWDIDVDDLDLVEHADYVMGRVMGRGTWEAMRWLRATYPAEVMADFLRRKGENLSPRDRAYWCLVSGATAEDVRGGGRPPWAGA